MQLSNHVVGVSSGGSVGGIGVSVGGIGVGGTGVGGTFVGGGSPGFGVEVGGTYGRRVYVTVGVRVVVAVVVGVTAGTKIRSPAASWLSDLMQFASSSSSGVSP